ncbi:uncharacterized protein LOC116012941 [Ipomoea triloba]|uniref:uncharacterized protein LOC116012941 n=1 Tax=Ipomoea triloba TaxID=35885 RepID=UPI00125E7B5B|nr:uncharacterized protein LOC116012941 [Ipomoea triloba]
MWWLWKWRNEVAFGGHEKEVQQKVEWLKMQEMEIRKSFASSPRGEGTLAGGGVVLRDKNGRWIEGRSFSFQASNPLETELRALELALRWTESKRIFNMEIQTDCKEMVKALNDANESNYQRGALKSRCRELIRRSGYTTVVHIFREQNFVADFLATLAANRREPCIIFVSPPPGCDTLVCNDQMRVVSERLLLETE